MEEVDEVEQNEESSCGQSVLEDKEDIYDQMP